MTDITVVASAEDNGVGDFDLDIAVPAGTLENDVMVVWCAKWADSVFVDPVGDGWTQIANEAVGTAFAYLCAYKVASGSEPASYTFPDGSGNVWRSGGITSFRDVDTSDPMAASPSFARTEAASTQPDPPSQDSLVASAMQVVVGNIAGSGFTPGVPAGFTETWVNGQDRAATAVGHLLRGAAGSYDAGAFTYSPGPTSQSVVGGTLMLRPAPSAPGAGAYDGLDWQEAVRQRIVLGGGSDTGQEGAGALAEMLGVTNTGEILGNLQAAGATSDGIPQAVDDLLSAENDLELNAALVLLAETWTA